MATHQNLTVASNRWEKVAQAPTLAMIQSRGRLVFAKFSVAEPALVERGFFVTSEGLTTPDLSSTGMGVWLRAQDTAEDVSVYVE